MTRKSKKAAKRGAQRKVPQKKVVRKKVGGNGKTAAKSPPAKPEEAPPPDAVAGTAAQRMEAMARASACNQKIQAVLQQMHCRLMPVLQRPVAVGEDGNCVQISATYAIIPDPLPE